MNKQTNEMPHNLEAEQSLLGCILIDQDIQLDVLSALSEDDFYAESHKYIFNAMKEINAQNVPIDLVTLIDALEKSISLEKAGGVDYLTDLTGIIPSTANYKHYLDIVKRDGILRRLVRGSSEIIKEAQNSTDDQTALAFAEKKIFDISSTLDTSSMVRIDSVIPEVMNKFDAINKDKNAFQGLKTGFTKLDYMTNGLHNTDYVLIAARPSYGKTSLAMNIVENIATTTDKVCAVFSLEMGKEQLAQRMVCSVAGISMEDALKGKLDKDKWLKVAKARELLSKAKIFIDDSALITPQKMLSKCRRLKRKHGLDLVMVDYIQLMNDDGTKRSDNRQVEISNISRGLKILAKEINVPVIALSQLSRSVEARAGQKPQLSDLRESGAIEQDADIVMFIHRPDRAASEKEIAEGAVQQNVAEIIIAKHRNGPTGVVKLYFKGECTKFVNLASDDSVPPEYSKNKQKKEDDKGDAPAEAPIDDGFDASSMEAPPEDSSDLIAGLDEPVSFKDIDDDSSAPDDDFWG